MRGVIWNGNTLAYQLINPVQKTEMADAEMNKQRKQQDKHHKPSFKDELIKACQNQD